MEDRRVAKNTRKTINDRRSAGRGAVCAASSALHDRPESDGPRSLSEELIRLGSLCQAGLITEWEFDHRKKLILDRYRHQQTTDRPPVDPVDLQSSRQTSDQH